MRQGKHPSKKARKGAVGGLDSLLSEQEAAAYLGVARITMMRMRQAHKIGFYQIGTRVLYDPDKHLRVFLGSVERRSAEKGDWRDGQGSKVGDAS